MFKTENFKLAWLTVATTTVVISSLISGASLLTALTSLAGILFVICIAYGKSVGNIYGALFNFGLALLSFNAGYYGNVVMCGLLFCLHIWGWTNWKNNSDKNNTVKIKSLKRREKAILSVILGVATLLATTFSYATGANLWLLDGISAVLPLVATVLLVNAYKEQWPLFIAFNIIQIVMWGFTASTDITIVALLVMKVIFLMNSFIGYHNWKHNQN